jgi:anti-sigma factor RsiW
MIPGGPVTAEDANALADGELTGQREAEVRRAVDSDPPLRNVVVWRSVLQSHLHATFDDQLARPFLLRTQRLFSARPAWTSPASLRRIAAVIAIAATAAALGFAGGHWYSGPSGEMDRLVRMALGAHQIFTGEIRHPVEVHGSDSAHLGKWLGARLGEPFDAPDISDTGFTLVGGRLLADGPRPAALLMYEDAGGLRVTLYMEHSPANAETPLTHVSSNGLDTFYWVDRNFACAVSGNLAEAKLKVLSEQLYAALDRT